MTTRSQIIDHTLLNPAATDHDITRLCEEAIEYGFFSVCVNPYWVARASELTRGSAVKVCTVIGFPLGANTTATKVAETIDAVRNGADEVDMVINIGRALAGDWDAVESDIRAVVEAAGENTLVKVILETCLLTDDQIVEACRRAVAAGADYVKTSTGFSRGGAQPHAVSLMRETVGPQIGVKAAGGIRTLKDFDAMVDAGASRIGTSAGISFTQEG